MEEKKEFAGWWLWVLVLMVFTSIVFAGLRFAGVWGERVVFENSFQYSEARKTEIATFEAQLASIERKLLSDVDKYTRTNLEAHADAIRIQLNVARRK